MSYQLSDPIGIGLRHTHFPEILMRFDEHETIECGWFEGISENFINTRGRPFEILMQVRERFDVSLHGVGLNIAKAGDLNREYLARLKELYHLVDPFLISDHLCWTGVDKGNLHNLLPFPYTSENLNLIAKRIDYVQDFLGREMAFENLSAYFAFAGDPLAEAQFLRELSLRTGCKILLDLNNVFVNSVNQKFNPYDYLEIIPMESVSEIHLAGHSVMEGFLFDSHSKPVCDEVWQLYHFICERNSIATLIEWDEDIPSLERVLKEAEKARLIQGALCES